LANALIITPFDKIFHLVKQEGYAVKTTRPPAWLAPGFPGFGKTPSFLESSLIIVVHGYGCFEHQAKPSHLKHRKEHLKHESE
jgi:hypothetical protein